MAEPKENVQMEKIVSLCKRRGFIFQSSEIYGGINGFWDYGPLGAELKRNLRDAWWQAMMRQREDIVGLDASIIMHRAVWKASGHEDTFSDPMCTCKHCKKLIRSDQWWTLMSEQPWVQSLAVLTSPETGAFEPEGLFKWAKGKGRHQAPNLALVRNPEAMLARLAQESEQGKRPKDAREFYLYLATEQPGAAGFVTPCPHCGGELTAPRPFNLMLKTHTGPVESDDNLAYLRPETAQAIFVQFKNIFESSRVRVPFGVGQIGKAFRNEITPRNFTFRSREFEQMELEFFIAPDEAVKLLCGSVAAWHEGADLSEPQPNWGWEMWHRYWVDQRTKFYSGIGLGAGVLDYYWQKKEELAHYARACVDILFKFPFGTEELEGIAARGDFDLTQHQKHSGKPMEVFDEPLRAAANVLTAGQKKDFVAEVQADWHAHNKSREEAALFCEKLFKGVYVPHVIEPSAGLDRMTLAALCAAYHEEQKIDAKGNAEQRNVLKLHPRIAPIKVGVFPLLKNKPELVAKARAVFKLLQPEMASFYDDSGAIGRRYARQDEAGTPFCVTIDFDTLGEKPELLDTVTLRYRDDGRQERLKISELRDVLLSKLRG
ncbi:MAG TPA: glycine--tRNA ligase [Candidatus Acidoferrales bacterium]|nr:glycine--tRNA ligase [Candidatus Acidoferrales bacterium]